MLGGFEGFGLGAEQFVLALQLFFFKPFFCGTELEVMGDDLRGGSAFQQLLLCKVYREGYQLILPRFRCRTRTKPPFFRFGKIFRFVFGFSFASINTFCYGICLLSAKYPAVSNHFGQPFHHSTDLSKEASLTRDTRKEKEYRSLRNGEKAVIAMKTSKIPPENF